MIQYLTFARQTANRSSKRCEGIDLKCLCLLQGHAELNQHVVFRCYVVMVLQVKV